mmetsp:Transcript_89155/g.224268  ORF Transcript_89155/g.224268 Transcript_89155/m.224268 type:complete len:616 (+) Transcript_89155:150-1997(+)
MSSRTSIQLEEGCDDDRLELPGQPYALALWNLIIRPPRRRYDLSRLGPTDFRLWSVCVKRVDVNLTNSRGMTLKCSHFLPRGLAEGGSDLEPRPVVIYLHQNASCRLEALNLVPLFLPLGISLFCFDFAGCGESDGEYISLGWFERDDLAECVEYLRKTGKVSAIGLWGRSMGAVTALLHADRDHSIGGMVLDSPFCNLMTLASELAQSEYLAVKVPSWLLSGALAVGRMRIRSLCGFDIEQLTPERHVGDSFIPALFVHGRGDDFIPPHHTEKLFEAYNGDKELEMVDGDHNSPRPNALNRKAVLFFCRAFRCSPTPQAGDDGNLARLLGLDTLGLDGSLDLPHVSRQLVLEAGRQLAIAGSCPRPPAGSSPPATAARPWLGDRQQVFLPFRAEGALQVCDPLAEAGFCICLVPAPSEWGGHSRPPEVLLAYAAADGLHLARASERGREDLAHARAEIDLAVPVLSILELRPSPTRLRLALGTGGLVLEHALREECEPEVFVWLWDSRRGEALFFDCAFMDLMHPLASQTDNHSSVDSEETSSIGTGTADGRSSPPPLSDSGRGAGAVAGGGRRPSTDSGADGAAARQQRRPSAGNSAARTEAQHESSGYCQSQ